MSERQPRLFVAVPLPEPARQEIAALRDENLALRYHGHLEELVQAMTGNPPAKPMNSIGCSIKWKR